jgi:hypothetical protein
MLHFEAARDINAVQIISDEEELELLEWRICLTNVKTARVKRMGAGSYRGLEK